MSLFCLLWIPLFYLFRRSVSGVGGSGGVWALLLGSVTAVFQFFWGDLINPGGFGLSRWFSGFVDMVSLPVLLPLAVYALLVLTGAFSGDPDFTGFTLLWLIPVAALRAVRWSVLSDPLPLTLVPLLWTALAAGIPFCVKGMTGGFGWHITVPSALGVFLLPLAAATSYWALFSQRPALGYPLFFASLVPLVIPAALDFIRAG